MDGDARLATRVPGDACRTESSLLLCGSRHPSNGRSHGTGSGPVSCALCGLRGTGAEHPEQARELRLNPFLSHRGDRPRQLDLWACRASWRCGARDITQHGRGCVHGAGRCAGAGPDVGYAWLAGGGLISVQRTPAHSHPLGAAANTPQGSHSGSAGSASQSRAPFGRDSHLSARLSNVVRETIASEKSAKTGEHRTKLRFCQSPAAPGAPMRPTRGACHKLRFRCTCFLPLH